MNDLLRSDSEEEYHFPESETTSAYSSQKKSNPRGLKKKNILVAVIIVLLILCLYKLADVLLSSYKLHPLGNHNAPTIATTPIQPVTPITPVTQSQVPVVSTDDRLSAVEKLAADNQTQIDRLSSSISDMQTSLTNLTDKMNTLTMSLQALTTKIQMQDEQIAALTPKPKPIPVKHARYVPRPLYFVKAIIPNRAWLAVAGGNSITVSVGDTLPGYGAIVEINPQLGTITTSSGAIIGYSPDDS